MYQSCNAHHWEPSVWLWQEFVVRRHLLTVVGVGCSLGWGRRLASPQGTHPHHWPLVIVAAGVYFRVWEHRESPDSSAAERAISLWNYHLSDMTQMCYPLAGQVNIVLVLHVPWKQPISIRCTESIHILFYYWIFGRYAKRQNYLLANLQNLTLDYQRA